MKTASILVFLFLSMLACEKSDTTIVDETIDPSFDKTILQEPMGDFSWKVFQKVVELEDEPQSNVIVSPLSIASALYMAFNGADGETEEAMAKTLELDDLTKDELNVAYAQYIQLLTDTNDGSELKSANAIFWDDPRVDPAESFLDKMTLFYHAETFGEDFQADPQVVLDKINQWVHEETNGRIEKILEQLDPMEIMFLVNALYFVGDWDQPFDANQTSDRAFTKYNGQTIDVPTMYQDNNFTYFIGEAFSAVECLFADSTYAMWFILPPADQPIDDWIQNSSFESIQKTFLEKAALNRLMLLLPKFEVNYKVQLNEALKSLGMEVAFNPFEANFGKLGESFGNLYLSRVEHKTFLKIDEKGAEGAAVTSVGIAVTSVPPSIRFNRPFVTVLMHKPTETIVFAGKVEDPENVGE